MRGARAPAPSVSYALRVRDPEEFLELRESLAKEGYRRLIVGGTLRDLDDVRPSEATAQGTRVEVVVDRLELRARDARRLQQAIETAWDRGGGRAELRDADFHGPLVRGLSCPKCGRAFDPPRPALFSYNSPLGACEACRGFGRVIAVDWDKVIPDPSLPLAKNAIKAWAGKSAAWERRQLAKFCARKGIPMDAPWEKLDDSQRSAVVEGEGSWRGGKFPGVRAWFKWLETRTYKMHVRVFLSRFREYTPCTTCHGARLNDAALAYRIAGKSLAEWHALTVSAALAGVRDFASRDPQGRIVLGELRARLEYLDAVGLGYITLDRQARTLSGGEAQRAGLTTALGARITGALFVLDEPSVGLHPIIVIERQPPRPDAVGDAVGRSGCAPLTDVKQCLVEAAQIQDFASAGSRKEHHGVGGEGIGDAEVNRAQVEPKIAPRVATVVKGHRAGTAAGRGYHHSVVQTIDRVHIEVGGGGADLAVEVYWGGAADV